MDQHTENYYKQLLSDVIRKQIVILGPDITLAKARNVAGLVVGEDGTVTQIQGNPLEITQKLVNQFMELSGLIVKKTMEPLLNSSAMAGTTLHTLEKQQTNQVTKPPSEPASPAPIQIGTPVTTPPVTNTTV